MGDGRDGFEFSLAARASVLGDVTLANAEASVHGAVMKALRLVVEGEV